MDEPIDFCSRSHSTVLSLTILLVVAAFVHVPFYFGHYYGEQDAARLVSDALVWQKAGIRSEAISEYRYYSSPAYIWLSMQAVSLSEVTAKYPAYYLNMLNLLVAIIIVVPLFFFFRRLSDHRSAFLATFLLLFVPAFWQSGLYGFPHLLSLLFLVCALLIYDMHLTDNSITLSNMTMTGMLILISVLLKADIFLGAIVVVLLPIYRKRVSRQNILWALGLLLVPVFVAFLVSKVLMSGNLPPTEYMMQWSTQYNVSISRLFSLRTIGGITMSMGLLSIPVFIMSLVWMLRRNRFSTAVVLAIWFAIPLAFWASRVGDSSRHHLQSSLPLALGIGIVFASLTWKPIVRYSALALLILLNYFAFPASSSTLAASGNLAGSAYLIKNRVSDYHRVAEQYAQIDSEKKVVFGTITNPYVDAEILYRAATVDTVRRYRLFGYDTIEIHYVMNDKKYISSSVRIQEPEVPAAIALFSNDGYGVFSMEFDREGKEACKYDTLVRLDQPIVRQ